MKPKETVHRGITWGGGRCVEATPVKLDGGFVVFLIPEVVVSMFDRLYFAGELGRLLRNLGNRRFQPLYLCIWLPRLSQSPGFDRSALALKSACLDQSAS